MFQSAQWPIERPITYNQICRSAPLRGVALKVDLYEPESVFETALDHESGVHGLLFWRNHFREKISHCCSCKRLTNNWCVSSPCCRIWCWNLVETEWGWKWEPRGVRLCCSFPSRTAPDACAIMTTFLKGQSWDTVSAFPSKPFTGGGEGGGGSQLGIFFYENTFNRQKYLLKTFCYPSILTKES